MGSVERIPYDHPIEIKVRFDLEAPLWTVLASNAIALVLAAYDLLTWLIQ